ncbi:piggyBac transposable element-derived protein 4-like [Sycon ciliatum]|uniref:piggyBac transposable element-derived protein 4-like n=1 Tax=Sycon ciliatum TaxID=27933 RepID=UPI0031F70272
MSRRTRILSLDEAINVVALDPNSDVEPDVDDQDDSWYADGDADDDIDDELDLAQHADDDVAEAAPALQADANAGGADTLEQSERSHKPAVEALVAGDSGQEGIWCMDDNHPDIPDFTAETGLNVELPESATPYDFVKLFFTPELWDLLVVETNRYATQYLATRSQDLPRHSRLRKWTPVTVPEMKMFMSLYLLMGIIVKPEIDMYWSTNPMVHTPIYSSSMARDRWCAILSFFHFADNETADADDKLAKLRPLITLTVRLFETVYTPSKQISIDEELVAWRGRLQFRQYIPSKRARFGVKIFALCESSGYMSSYIVYVGKDDATFSPELVNNLGKSGAVVARLMEPFVDKGYHLYVDNWYSSVDLARYLADKGTMVCGTIRSNRRGLPKRTVAYKGLKKGEFVFRSWNGIIFVKLSDTKVVHFLSTLHSAEVVDTGKRDLHRLPIRKLALVHDYNLFMGGVDRNDEMLSFYTCARKTQKWYKKLAAHLLEECMLNAFVLHKKFATTPRKHTDFITIALQAMLQDGKSGCTAAAAAAPATPVPRTVMMAAHMPACIPPTAKKATPTRVCRYCSKTKGVRKESRYCCLQCPNQPGLCAAPCFSLWHQ